MLRKFIFPITNTINAYPTIISYLKDLGFSTSCLTQLKHTPGSVQINGLPVFLNHEIKSGDELIIILDENISSPNIIPVELPLSIVYEDEDILVVNKPADMPIHPSQNNHDNSLGNAVAWYYQKQNIPFVFRCINRLDRNTSGLTIIAKNMVSASILSAQLSDKKSAALKREYLAIVKGSLSPTNGVITAPIARKEGSTIERIVDFKNGEAAITHYNLVHEKNGHSLVSLNLETGRTHQIRVHMKYIGFPLIGDYIYNPDMEVMQRQALHSYRLTFTHPITHEHMDFVCPLPKDMEWMA